MAATPAEPGPEVAATHALVKNQAPVAPEPVTVEPTAASEPVAAKEPAVQTAVQTADGDAAEPSRVQADAVAVLQPAYRAEMPLVSALPAQLRQGDLAMLGDLHKRMGDEAGDVGHDRRAWGRMLRADADIRQSGSVRPQSTGHLNGFQVGHDLYADHGVKAGLYVGQLEGNMRVAGVVSAAERGAVGFNRLQSRYLGVYGSWQDAAGMYVDGVAQWADYRSQVHTNDNSHATVKGDGWLASLEIGRTFALSSQWHLEPQAQFIYRQISLDDTALNQAQVKHSTPGDWTLRLGMRIKASLSTSVGIFQPYGRINVYKTSRTTDLASLITADATTDIQARNGYTATELAMGGTLQLNPSTSLYGELGQRWAHGGEARVKSSLQASAGLKLHW